LKIKLLDDEDCFNATKYVLDLNRQKEIEIEGEHRFSRNNQFTRRLYMDPYFCSLALQVQPALESFYNIKLYPTYTYARLYLPGYTMFPHLDRPACEFSSSLTIGYGGRKSPWELYIEDDEGNEQEYILYPGEGLLYKGREYHHWRYPLDRGWQLQTFVHYIEIDGEVHTELKNNHIELDINKPFQDFYCLHGVWMLKDNFSVDN